MVVIIIITGGIVYIRSLEPISFEDIACRADEPIIDGKSIDVPINVIDGSRIFGPNDNTELNGTMVNVSYFIGDEYESQSFLRMSIFESEKSSVSSTMYDYHFKKQTGPINILSFIGENGLVRLQCWIDN